MSRVVVGLMPSDGLGVNHRKVRTSVLNEKVLAGIKTDRNGLMFGSIVYRCGRMLFRGMRFGCREGMFLGDKKHIAVTGMMSCASVDMAVAGMCPGGESYLFRL